MLHAQSPPQRSIWDGIYNRSQADRGKAAEIFGPVNSITATHA